MMVTSAHSVLPTPPQPLPLTPHVNSTTLNDKVIQQLLNKLDKGAETIMNLRSLLTQKTAQLNELVRQLELIDDVLIHVEEGTEQIELVLKDVISAGHDKLLHAEATLDSAIQSACSLYSIDSKPSSHYEQQRMMIVNKINNVLDELNINASSFWTLSDENVDLEVLQHMLVNLDLAKTIATTIKNEAKLRSTMLKNNNNAASLKKMSDKLRCQIELYKSYTRNHSLLLNGKEDLLSILDREDKIITKQQQPIATTTKINTSLSTAKTNAFIATTKTNVSIATTKKKRPSTTTTVAMTTVNNKPSSQQQQRQQQQQQHTNTNINKQTMSLLLLARHTSSSKAKSKEPKRPQLQQELQQQRGPGSTLRLRNMLAKRNPALNILTEQKSGTTVC